MCLNLCFASLIDINIDTASSAVGLKLCTKVAVIKKYKSIIMKKEKKAWWNGIDNKN